MRSFLFALLTLSFVFYSCDDDTSTSSSISYGLLDYRLSDLLEEDWGTHTGAHYNKDFTFVGEQTIFEENLTGTTVYYTFSEEIDCYIFLELFTPGEVFSVGAFNALGNRKVEDVGDECVFRRFFFGQSTSELIVSDEGMVTLSRLPNGFYKISFDVVLENGKELKGSYIGPSIYVNHP